MARMAFLDQGFDACYSFSLPDRVSTITPLDHDHCYLSVNHDRNTRRTATAAVLAVVTMVVEFAADWWTGSLALLAAAFTWTATPFPWNKGCRLCDGQQAFPRSSIQLWHWKGRRSDRFCVCPYPHLCRVRIRWEFVSKLVHPTNVAYGRATLVAALGRSVNLGNVVIRGAFGAEHSNDHARGHDHDLNLRSAIVRVATNAGTSVLAIPALGLGRVFAMGWADPVAGLIGGSGHHVEGSRIDLRLCDDPPGLRRPCPVDRIRDIADKNTTILDLHVWRLSPHGDPQPARPC